MAYYQQPCESSNSSKFIPTNFIKLQPCARICELFELKGILVSQSVLLRVHQTFFFLDLQVHTRDQFLLQWK